MPSEKRRQRQQRVRHEAGDYAPASSQTNESPVSESIVKTSKPPEEPLKETTNQIPVSHENISAPQRNNDNNVRRGDQGRNDNRYKDRGRGGSARGQGRGRGASNDNRKRENVQGHRTANVVFAEEEREYEPVMIMESKKDAPSEAEKLPQTSEPLKYRRREVISNWLRYDELPPEEEAVDGEDYMLGEDFSSILNLNVTKGTGSFLHLKGEMSWGKIDNSDFNSSYGLGALKIADLVRALGTIPLYDQLKIPEEVLPVFTASVYKDSARQNLKTYQPDLEYVTDIEMTNQSILESLRLKESEPISLLKEEESKPVDKSDNVDATLKFSSAFQPEPDDVDLDKFVADSVSQSSEVREEGATTEKTKAAKEKDVKVKRKPEPKKSDSTPDKSSPPPEEPKPKETSPPLQPPERKIFPKTTQQPTPEPKTGFDFGLSKAPKTAPPTIAKKVPDPHTKAKKKEEVEEEKIIDLDQPIANKSGPPVLVGKSEVENLEDWLDSVLDD